LAVAASRKKARVPKKQAPPSAKASLSKAERREQILAAAQNVFAKRGYARSTVDDIVAEAGVARGTFYLYFGDKRDAFAALIDAFAERITLAILRIDTDDVEHPVATQVLQNIRAILRVCLAERSLTKILFTDAVGVDPEFERKLGTFYDAVVHLLTESLKDGQALGVVGDGEPRVMAYLTIGALKELLYQAVTLGLSEESADALSHQVFAFLAAGYLRVEPETQRKTRAR
jgi:AcrR family transcriptional regulator